MSNNAHSDRQRLLKLIVGNTAALKAVEKNKKFADTSRRLREILYLLRGKVLEGLRRLRSGDISFSGLQYIPINKILVVMLAVMSAYLIVGFVGVTVFRRGNAVPSTAKYENKKGPSFTELSPLGYYLDQVTGKEIFNPQRLAQASAAREETSSAEPFAGFKLVGIDWGEHPVALIEDTQAGKTYFVKKGDSVKDMKVMEVLRDRVKIIYYNKLFELK